MDSTLSASFSRDLTNTQKKEYLLLILLPPVVGGFAILIGLMIAEAWSGTPRPLTWHMVYGAIEYWALPSEIVFILPVGFLFGMVLLLTLDEYKSVHGLIIFGGFALIGVALYVEGSYFPDPSTVDSTTLTNAAGYLLVGAVGGILFGGVRRTLQRGYPYEFNRVIPRLTLLLGVLVVVSFVEANVVYQSPFVKGSTDYWLISNFSEAGVVSVDPDNDMIWDFIGSAGFIGVLMAFRSYTETKNTVIFGPQRSGKTLMMAGLNYNVRNRDDIPSEASDPLKVLTDEIKAKPRFDSIPPTPKDLPLPLELSYKHGRIFPKKVNIRTFDYAGELASNFIPAERPAQVATESVEEAIDVARYLAWKESDEEGAETRWIRSEEPVGTDPDDISMLSDLADEEIAGQLLKDIVYHSGSIAFVLPMDDFAQEADVFPEYVDGVPEPPNARPPRWMYLNVYEDTAEEYSGEKDMFFIATMADLVVEDYIHHEDSIPLNAWEDFREYVTDVFLASSITTIEQHFGRRKTEDPYPVYFVVDEDSPVTSRKESIILDPPTTEYALHGAKWLLDRFGYRKIVNQLLRISR